MRTQRKIFLKCAIVLFLVVYTSESIYPERHSVISFREKDISKVLLEIYQEMKEFENYPGCDFIKREFFVGEDDDDTNKDIHVVILVQDLEEKEKLTIQVTYMERSKGKPVIGIAKNTKVFSFFVRDGLTEIVKSDYENEEMERVLSGVLQAIKNKKKLLKEIDNPAKKGEARIAI